mgnify:CR=1 FL=1
MRRKLGSPHAEKARSETVSLRLDPRLKYLCEIASRLENRSLSAFAAAALESRLLQSVVEVGPTSGRLLDLDKDLTLWDPDEATRIAKLAFHVPTALLFAEKEVWKRVRASKAFWRPPSPTTPAWAIDPELGALRLDMFRSHLPKLYQLVEDHAPLDLEIDWDQEPVPSSSNQ